MTKTCTKCKLTKNLSNFHNKISSKDGKHPNCKLCRRITETSIYYNKNKDKIKKSAKLYHEKNIEQILQYRKSEKYKIAKRKHDKKYREKTKGKYTEYKRIWQSNKLHTDSDFKLRCTLRHRISVTINKKYKSVSSIKLLGCTIEEARQHLESQFTEGMTWENHGDWHIDHIRPCASFDLTDPEQQKECFNYKNLQPLWAYDNLSKGDKWKGTKNE